MQSLALPEQHTAKQTGVYTLENGGNSFIARLWLFAHAQKTIDIQYYSFAKDITGILATEYLLQAADRGVKIRLLIDDAASKMYTYEIGILNAHTNIETKIYNPGLMLGRADRRIRLLVKNRNRLLRRMHNKTLTVDGLACIVGGRNIADIYFDCDSKYNFRDRDLLMIGKAVKDVTTSFDTFWNDSLTHLFSDLSGNKNRKVYTGPIRFKRLLKSKKETNAFADKMRSRVDSFPHQITAADKSGTFRWVTAVSFVSDKPGKNEDRAGRDGGISTDTLLSLIRSAHSSIEIESPYFISTPEVKELMQQTIHRGVTVRLLTNSLASIDNPEAFSGYQKERKDLLIAGMRIYEFKPKAQVRYKLMMPDVQEKLKYKPIYGFHPKTVIIDKHIVVIGSYNFDPRSGNYNTECFSVIRSPEMAKLLLNYFEEDISQNNSWEVSAIRNPDSKAPLKKRLKAWIFRVFPKKLM